MKMTAIVALYNPNLQELKNIGKYIELLDECIFMDDSSENHENMICSFFEKQNVNFRYIWNKKNVGLCASVNNGIKEAVKNKANWVILMNPDSCFETDIVQAYKKYINSHDISQISALAPQYNYDRHPRKSKQYSRKIGWANMSGMCINIQNLSDIGLFDERLFIDGMDIEWCVRAKKKGYDLVEIGTAVLLHHPAITRHIKFGNRTLLSYGWDSSTRYYYQFRSYWYIIKTYKDLDSVKWMLIKLIKILLLFNNKGEYLKKLYEGIHDANIGVWGKYNQKTKKND